LEAKVACVIVDTGCWMLVAGCWLLDAGCWMLDAGCWMLDAGCWNHKVIYNSYIIKVLNYDIKPIFI
jgi:hypothetical protein